MILMISGARPNFMKIAPLCWKFKKLNIDYKVLTTGQHYSPEMSSNIISELNIDNIISFDIDNNLKVFEKFGLFIQNINDTILELNPKLLIVVGDVDSTLAGTLAGVRNKIPIAHVESGLRSYDLSMPEEINRIIVDRFSKYLFCTEKSGIENLKKENVLGKKYLVGNIVIDSLIKILEREYSEKYYKLRNILKDKYCLLTLHRPFNVDNKYSLLSTLFKINESVEFPILFPIHPRTKKSVENEKFDNIYFCDPLSYTDMVHLMKNSKLVLTDSGGIQDETTFLGIPCITLRDNTERPITLEYTNKLVGSNPPIEELKNYVSIQLETDNRLNNKVPKFWDGSTSRRIINILLKDNI